MTDPHRVSGGPTNGDEGASFGLQSLAADLEGHRAIDDFEDFVLAMGVQRRPEAWFDDRFEDRVSPADSSARHADFDAFARNGAEPAAFIDIARDLLASRAPLAEIDITSGFADQSHLTRIFKRMTGTTPAAWRRLYRAP